MGGHPLGAPGPGPLEALVGNRTHLRIPAGSKESERVITNPFPSLLIEDQAGVIQCFGELPEHGDRAKGSSSVTGTSCH